VISVPYSCRCVEFLCTIYRSRKGVKGALVTVRVDDDNEMELLDRPGSQFQNALVVFMCVSGPNCGAWSLAVSTMAHICAHSTYSINAEFLSFAAADYYRFTSCHSFQLFSFSTPFASSTQAAARSPPLPIALVADLADTSPSPGLGPRPSDLVSADTCRLPESSRLNV
jgi:hypothetical protein